MNIYTDMLRFQFPVSYENKVYGSETDFIDVRSPVEHGGGLGDIFQPCGHPFTEKWGVFL